MAGSARLSDLMLSQNGMGKAGFESLEPRSRPQCAAAAMVATMPQAILLVCL